MYTIDEKLKSQDIKKTPQVNLDEFYRKMEIIKKYPVTPIEFCPKYSPWTLKEQFVF